LNRTQRIIELHHQGFEAASIAHQLGIPPHVAEEVLREAGLPAAAGAAAEAGEAAVVLATAAVTAPPPRPRGQRPALTTTALAAGGFHRTGGWVVASGGRLEIIGTPPAKPGLYAFAAGGRALYLGLTLRRLDARLNQYRSGEGEQAATARMRARLLEALSRGPPIEIHTVTPPDGVWSGWPVSTASGLEVALLKRYDLPWNGRAKAAKGR